MAGRGGPPKAQRSRSADTARRDALTNKISADGVQRGPDLPDGVLPNGEEWHPRTCGWWRTWRESAQAQAFTTTDWDFLLDTALMHHTMWTRGRWEFAGEIRLRAAKFGATPEDRLRLRMSVETPASEQPETESSEEQNTAAGRRKDLRIVG